MAKKSELFETDLRALMCGLKQLQTCKYKAGAKFQEMFAAAAGHHRDIILSRLASDKFHGDICQENTVFYCTLVNLLQEINCSSETEFLDKIYDWYKRNKGITVLSGYQFGGPEKIQAGRQSWYDRRNRVKREFLYIREKLLKTQPDLKVSEEQVTGRSEILRPSSKHQLEESKSDDLSRKAEPEDKLRSISNWQTDCQLRNQPDSLYNKIKQKAESVSGQSDRNIEISVYEVEDQASNTYHSDFFVTVKPPEEKPQEDKIAKDVELNLSYKISLDASSANVDASAVNETLLKEKDESKYESLDNDSVPLYQLMADSSTQDTDRHNNSEDHVESQCLNNPPSSFVEASEMAQDLSACSELNRVESNDEPMESGFDFNDVEYKSLDMAASIDSTYYDDSKSCSSYGRLPTRASLLQAVDWRAQVSPNPAAARFMQTPLKNHSYVRKASNATSRGSSRASMRTSNFDHCSTFYGNGIDSEMMQDLYANRHKLSSSQCSLRDYLNRTPNLKMNHNMKNKNFNSRPISKCNDNDRMEYSRIARPIIFHVNDKGKISNKQDLNRILLATTISKPNRDLNGLPYRPYKASDRLNQTRETISRCISAGSSSRTYESSLNPISLGIDQVNYGDYGRDAYVDNTVPNKENNNFSRHFTNCDNYELSRIVSSSIQSIRNANNNNKKQMLQSPRVGDRSRQKLTNMRSTSSLAGYSLKSSEGRDFVLNSLKLSAITKSGKCNIERNSSHNDLNAELVYKSTQTELHDETEKRQILTSGKYVDKSSGIFNIAEYAENDDVADRSSNENNAIKKNPKVTCGGKHIIGRYSNNTQLTNRRSGKSNINNSEMKSLLRVRQISHGGRGENNEAVQSLPLYHETIEKKGRSNSAKIGRSSLCRVGELCSDMKSWEQSYKYNLDDQALTRHQKSHDLLSRNIQQHKLLVHKLSYVGAHTEVYSAFHPQPLRDDSSVLNLAATMIQALVRGFLIRVKFTRIKILISQHAKSLSSFVLFYRSLNERVAHRLGIEKPRISFKFKNISKFVRTKQELEIEFDRIANDGILYFNDINAYLNKFNMSPSEKVKEEALNYLYSGLPSSTFVMKGLTKTQALELIFYINPQLLLARDGLRSSMMKSRWMNPVVDGLSARNYKGHIENPSFEKCWNLVCSSKLERMN